MKRATILCVIGNNEKLAFLYEKYRDESPREFRKWLIFKGASLQLPLEPDSVALKNAKEYVERHGGHVDLFSMAEYTKKELEEIPFFYLDHLRDPLELEGGSSEYYGTQYEITCPRCHFRTNLCSDILVDRKYLRRYKNLDIGVLYPDVFVSERLKTLIEENGLTGVSFDHRVLDYKQREMEPFYALTVSNVLPPVSSSTWFGSQIDFPCGHNKTYLRSDLQYEREKLQGALDFNLTCEYVNNGRHQVLVVSKEVRDLFKEFKIREHFTPVALL